MVIVNSLWYLLHWNISYASNSSIRHFSNSRHASATLFVSEKVSVIKVNSYSAKQLISLIWHAMLWC